MNIEEKLGGYLLNMSNECLAEIRLALENRIEKFMKMRAKYPGKKAKVNKMISRTKKVLREIEEGVEK